MPLSVSPGALLDLRRPPVLPGACIVIDVGKLPFNRGARSFQTGSLRLPKPAQAWACIVIEIGKPPFSRGARSFRTGSLRLPKLAQAPGKTGGLHCHRNRKAAVQPGSAELSNGQSASSQACAGRGLHRHRNRKAAVQPGSAELSNGQSASSQACAGPR